MTKGQAVTPSTWVLVCTHPDYQESSLDFAELGVGAGEAPPSGAKIHNWLGGFSGRPGLLNDLMPAITVSYRDRPLISCQNLKGALRAFWRFLDTYEEWQRDNGRPIPRIDRLHHISGAILDLFSQPGPENRWKQANDTRAAQLRALILDAVHLHGLPELNMSTLARRRGSPRDTPTDEEGLSLIRYLRGEVAGIFRRWQRADALAATGRDLITLLAGRSGRVPRELAATEADAHATYRALIQRVGHPLPHVKQLLHALQLGTEGNHQIPMWWPRYSGLNLPPGRSEGDRVSWMDCSSGLYPNSADIATCVLLCLARSAWNPSTLLNLDIEDWHATYDKDHAWIYAPKDRVRGVLQHTISSTHHPTNIYHIIRRLIQRNDSLRHWVRGNKDSVLQPEIALRTPWLGTSNKPADLLFVADPRRATTLNNWLTRHITNHNEWPGRKTNVRAMTCGDFRDIAAAIMYRESRYSTWTLMLMLGHKNMSTTRIYGYRHSTRQESHKLVAQVLDNTLQQIGDTRSWDSVLTRAKIEGVQVTADGVQRLNDYRRSRTYSGAICQRPLEPPISIDPNHPRDGMTPCIQGHLCVARKCPHATVLNDSLSDICKTVAELEWRQAHTGLVRFATGSEERDLHYLQQTIKQWPEQDAERYLLIWRARIERGEHRPLLYGGRH